MRYIFACLYLLICKIALAQIPQGFNYQAVARDATGQALLNAPLGIRLSLIPGNASGTALYQETHAVSSNAFGLFSLVVGQGVPVMGTFTSVPFSTQPVFLKMEIDPAGGTDYTDMGTMPLLSVPYAKVAESALSNDTLWGHNNNAVYRENGSLGIGTADPLAKFHVSKGSVIFDDIQGGVPTNGAGTRLMWIPEKRAFRAGAVSANDWDTDSIGEYSWAGGYNCRAKGYGSVALGAETKALGNTALALGNYTTAGNLALALGHFATASGSASIAIGHMCFARSDNAAAIGVHATADGSQSVALGFDVTTSAGYSTALGNAVRTMHPGACMIGDASVFGTPSTSSASNELTMRFAGGYRLYSNSTLSSGVSLAPGGGAWLAVSDRNKKENFKAEDGEWVLQQIRSLAIPSWNYKSQDPLIRHVGPVAQDFYAAFRIGESDTTITTSDIDGINMLAIQALEKRTAELKEKTSELDLMKEKVAILERRLLLVEAALTENSSGILHGQVSK